MSIGTEFEGKDLREAVRNACNAHFVEPRMLKYEVLEEREPVVGRTHKTAGFCRIKVVSAKLVADVFVEAPAGDDRGPRRDDRGPRREGRDRGGRGEGDRGGRGERDRGGRGERDRGGRGERDRGGRGERDRGGRGEGRQEVPPRNPEAMEKSAEMAEELTRKLFTGMGFEATLTVEDTEERVIIEVACEDAAMDEVGRDQVFESVQYIVNIVVRTRKHGKWVRVSEAGARERRETELRTLAAELAERALSANEVVKVEPMPSGDRRIIHQELGGIDGVSTRSEGSGAFRHLLIVPDTLEENVDGDDQGE
jgi:predicted RNA-binding protein Jag